MTVLSPTNTLSANIEFFITTLFLIIHLLPILTPRPITQFFPIFELSCIFAEDEICEELILIKLLSTSIKSSW